MKTLDMVESVAQGEELSAVLNPDVKVVTSQRAVVVELPSFWRQGEWHATSVANKYHWKPDENNYYDRVIERVSKLEGVSHVKHSPVSGTVAPVEDAFIVVFPKDGQDVNQLRGVVSDELKELLSIAREVEIAQNESASRSQQRSIYARSEILSQDIDGKVGWTNSTTVRVYTADVSGIVHNDVPYGLPAMADTFAVQGRYQDYDAENVEERMDRARRIVCEFNARDVGADVAIAVGPFGTHTFLSGAMVNPFEKSNRDGVAALAFNRVRVALSEVVRRVNPDVGQSGYDQKSFSLAVNAPAPDGVS